MSDYNERLALMFKEFNLLENMSADLILLGIVEPLVIKVRTDLSDVYDVSYGSEHQFFKGLCYAACEMLKKEVESWAHEHALDITFTHIHGEQRHSPICRSENWIFQHSWGKVTWGNIVLYVDPTSSQFMDIYEDVPEYYINMKAPKWYYNDRDNPAFNGITGKINEMIKIPLYVKSSEGRRWVKEGLIEFLQYCIWGPISDFIRGHIMHI